MELKPTVISFADQNKNKNLSYREYRNQRVKLDGDDLGGWNFSLPDSIIIEKPRIGQVLISKQIFSHSRGDYWDSTFIYTLGDPIALLKRKKPRFWTSNFSEQEAEEKGIIETLELEMNFDTNIIKIPLHDNLRDLLKIKTS